MGAPGTSVRKATESRANSAVGSPHQRGFFEGTGRPGIVFGREGPSCPVQYLELSALCYPGARASASGGCPGRGWPAHAGGGSGVGLALPSPDQRGPPEAQALTPAAQVGAH